MGWYPCECCGSCCTDPTLGCGCICVGKNPCSTTLTINGNHPAVLRFPISYTRNPLSNTNQIAFCGLEGCSTINRATSTGHTFTKEWTEQERLWDGIQANCYFCCPEFIDDFGTEVPYLSSTIEGRGVYVASRCYKAIIRYMNLDVSIRQGRQVINGENVCGVYVTAKLTFRRHFNFLENVCQYKYAKVVPYEVPCLAVFPPPDLTPRERACSYCNPGGGPFTPGADYSTQPFPTVPSCPTPEWGEDNPPNDPSNPVFDNIYCLGRSKFVPFINSVSCKSEAFTVTLGPEHNTLSGTNCCGPLGDRAVPSDVYYDYELPDVDYPCGSFTNCRGQFNMGPTYGNWLGPNRIFPGNGFGDLTGNQSNCTNAQNSSTNPFIQQCQTCEITQRNRGKNLVRPVPKNTLLFGEANDQWSLNILCSD
jgi:hypothetical protein